MSDVTAPLGRKWRLFRTLSLCLVIVSVGAMVISLWRPRIGVHSSTGTPEHGRIFTSIWLVQGMFDFTNRLSVAGETEGSAFFWVYPLVKPRGPIRFLPPERWHHVNRVPIGNSTWYIAFTLPLWIPAVFFSALAFGSHCFATRPRRRFRAGLCPKCAYPLNETGCSECGWTRDGTRPLASNTTASPSA